ncbi:MAG: type II secretion system protein [Candidatus Omnitrophota bacterium]|nr:type II secretion system protein [Candidatus Omnitrophota bacterium]
MLLIGKKTKNSGFLLLEVMISVSILSFGLLLILNSFMKPIRAAELSKDYFKAELLLEEKMFEVCNSDITEGSLKGSFSGFNNMFSWDMSVVESEEGAFKEIGLKVLWNERGKEQDMAVSTYL